MNDAGNGDGIHNAVTTIYQYFILKCLNSQLSKLLLLIIIPHDIIKRELLLLKRCTVLTIPFRDVCEDQLSLGHFRGLHTPARDPGEEDRDLLAVKRAAMKAPHVLCP